jgi:D-alanyl-D-alanine carboxypeptidase
MPRTRRQLWQELGIPADYAQRRRLPLQREAARLVSIGPAADDGQPLRLTPRAAAAWRRMRAAAAQDGVTLLPLSAFRSLARQAAIIRRKRAAGETLAEILRLVAAPGCSEHHTGRALDLASPLDLQLDADLARTPEFRWLRCHAGRFGFTLSYPRGNPHGIAYEPWHWCYTPRRTKPAATSVAPNQRLR